MEGMPGQPTRLAIARSRKQVGKRFKSGKSGVYVDDSMFGENSDDGSATNEGRCGNLPVSTQKWTMSKFNKRLQKIDLHHIFVTISASIVVQISWAEGEKPKSLEYNK